MLDTIERHRPVSIAALEILAAMDRYLRYSFGKERHEATVADLNQAMALAVRERVIDAMIATEHRYQSSDAKRVHYLSIEFLMGRLLDNALVNLDLSEPCRQAAAACGLDLQAILDAEPDPALGNGGLGRLAACYLDSLATLDMPGYGYGICYEFGLFQQSFVGGAQQEHPDRWLKAGSAWLIERADLACSVPLYGRIEHGTGPRGEYKPRWVDTQELVGVPHDMPVVGYGGRTVNRLRLYAAKPSSDFDMQIFNRGDYMRAVEWKIASETVSKVLYPEDSVAAGKELRFIQNYFFVACALQDIVRDFKTRHVDLRGLAEKAAVQMNDTHPALAVAELMRLLIDQEGLEWHEAWPVTQAVLGYTNHTLLPEALERWPVDLIERVLPRHMQIIYEINRWFLREVDQQSPGDFDRLARMSIIEEHPVRCARMGHLAIVGSHSVNGVAALHSELITKTFGRDFADLYPDRFNNKTNGITQRRWVLKANPRLAELATARVGAGWITDLHQLRGLERYVDDPETLRQLGAAKRSNKERLADLTRRVTGYGIDPASIFDVQVKRMHEYKRQLLNLLSAVDLYFRIVEDGLRPEIPRTLVFAGKAAPGYLMAKLVIRLINGVAERVNDDPLASRYLRVVMLPDYRVSLAEKIIPAADLSEQISTAGFEASGTGNMKLALNGALTIGTLDGANVEIRQEVGAENMFIFGKAAEEIRKLQLPGAYSAWDLYAGDARLQRTIDALRGELFCPGEAGLFEPIVRALLDGNDRYFVLADFAAYVEAKDRAIGEYADPLSWNRKALLNVARMGEFSSDRSIRQYAAEIWKIRPIPA